MKVSIRNRKDFYSALIFIAFGAAVVVMARDYSMGSLLRMGPAYFPTVLGAILVVLGALVLFGSLTVDGPSPGRLAWRPIIFILGSVVAFALLLQPLGLIGAIAALIIVSTFVGADVTWIERIILIVILAVFSVLLFVKFLGLPFPVYPAFMQ